MMSPLAASNFYTYASGLWSQDQTAVPATKQNGPVPSSTAATTEPTSSLTADDTQLLSTLTDGGYGQQNMPDYAVVATGADVTPQYSGGNNVIGIVSNWGTVTFYGGTVSSSSASGQSSSAKAMVVTFSPDATPQERQQLVSSNQDFLYEHLNDSQNAAGQWKRSPWRRHRSAEPDGRVWAI